ncbi:hypothetical protein O181_087093 [Austropuccinia psidii MF-1]|uniref:Uncharacterized protein n=1 Tax=Austropuccinia psidii MF-1 TaxID=1389203 RepID=A0A9Q3IP16_9BASI|nr:hypothetical protein [Austropuccinia psidii MF-1]
MLETHAALRQTKQRLAKQESQNKEDSQSKKPILPDGLSRRPRSEDEEKEKSDFDDEEEWIKPHPGFGVKHNNIIKCSEINLPSKQERFWKRMVEYLNTSKRPFGSKEDDFKKIKTKSSNFFLEEGQLKRRNTLNPQVAV